MYHTLLTPLLNFCFKKLYIRIFFFTKTLVIITTEFTRTVVSFVVKYIVSIDVRVDFKP